MNQLPPVKNVCRGCLSRNRILQIITHEELKKLYFSIIDKESFQQHCLGPLVLCWECITKIHKYKMFRHQCALAHKLLVKYLAAPSPIRSLSKLTIVKNNVQITIPHTSEESQNIWVKTTPPEISNGEDLTGDFEYNIASKVYNYDDNHTKYEEDPYGVNGTSIKLNSENKSGTNDSAKEEIVLFSSDKQTDVQFIKVEDDASLGLEELYIDDSFNDQDDIDNKEFSIEEDLNDKENSKLKSKRRKKKITENEFDDSDEEPLKNKKRKKDLKEKKHKKKKDKGKASSKAKVAGGKREKPAGVVSNARVLKKLQQLNVAEGSLEMVVLSWEEVEEERQKALLSIVFTRHKYRCHDCIVGFNHKFKLDNHMKKHDPSYGEMECSVCRVRCKDSHALCAHRRRHRVRWRCCECGATWSRAAVAADHVAREHHAPPPTHTCSVCGHAETSLGKLRNHIKNHAERQKCELCGKTFRDRTSLRTHLFIHKGEKEFGCARCGKRFLFKKALELHLVTHDASALLYCVQCDMNFKNRMSFTQHMKYSLKHIDPAKLKFSCALCDKRFAKAARLREHHVAVHLKATPVRCHLPGCSFACSSRPVLRTHIRMVHRNARAQRNHVCDACGKTYTTKKSLEGHLRSHSGARPFACARCAATFGYEAALYNHNKLVHLRDKTTRRAGAVPSPPTQQATEATGHIP